MDRPPGVARPICACGCGEFIPEERIRHEGLKRTPKFCDREHFLRWRKESGWYSRFSKLGMDAQMELAKEQGERPGSDKRRAVLDQVRNRSGRKTGRHDMSKPSYYAISMLGSKTIGQQRVVGDWFILSGPHASKEVVEERGKEEAEKAYPRKDSIERATLLKNLTVVTKSQLRQYRVEVEANAE